MSGKRFLVGYFLFVLFLICVSRFAAYFDVPEYVEVVTKHSFTGSFLLGHPPIHPLFNGLLWATTHLLNDLLGISFAYAANIFSFLVSLGSVGVLILIFKRFVPNNWWLGVVLFCLTPLFFLTSTNLFVETLTFFWYLLICYLSLKYWEKPNIKAGREIILVTTLGVLTHLELVFWSPSILAICLLSYPLADFSKSLKKLLLTYGVGLILSGFIYMVCLYLKNPQAGGDLGRIFGLIINQTFTGNLILAVGRVVRNVFLSASTGFGLVYLIILSWLFVKNTGQKNIFWAFGLFGLSVLLSGNMWGVDLMARRVIFAGLFIFLVVAKYCGKYLKWLLIYSLIMWFPVFLTNSGLLEKPPLALMNQMEKDLPIGSTLIQSQYLRPFVNSENKKVVLLGIDDFSWEKTKSPVFMDSQALFAPYLLYAGNNLHITSLGKTGISEGKKIVTESYYNLYSVTSAKDRIFSYQLFDNYQSVDLRKSKLNTLVNEDTVVVWGQTNPEATIMVYSKRFIDRLLFQRLNYSEPLVWMSSFILNRKDPVLWTYADKSGYFVFPIARGLSDNFYLDSKDSLTFEVLK